MSLSQTVALFCQFLWVVSVLGEDCGHQAIVRSHILLLLPLNNHDQDYVLSTEAGNTNRDLDNSRFPANTKFNTFYYVYT